MSWEEDRARELMAAAEERVVAGRNEVALATWRRAFDVLDQSAPSTEKDLLRLRILEDMLPIALRSKCTDALLRHAITIRERLPADRRLSHEIVHALAIEGQHRDLGALRVYVAWIARVRDPDPKLIATLLRILSEELKVKLKSDPDEVAPKAPLLERLNAVRPSLAFPRLYLGRYHYLKRDYSASWELLRELKGPLRHQVRIVNLMACCAEKLGLLDQAVDLYEESLASRVQQPHMHFRLGRVLTRMAVGESSLASE